ncbi:MAG: nitrite reductase, copper-containing [Kiritimatiellae bacterium]|nr:nitrite reductase, copper-containing [Kiritimatiellia bacterium]MCO5068592.1 copper-containing nitrite reductase [Kiritimatiellia bacterium]
MNVSKSYSPRLARIALGLFAVAALATSASGATLPVEEAVLTHAPNVPPPITRRTPAKVVINLEVRELIGKLADGVEYTFWTFGSTVPGPFIRVREGDHVEFHLHNFPDNKLPHNIDLHAVTGPGGGAAASFTAPGHTSTFNFKPINPGLYVYHCATAPVGMHVANGMYGLILVEPEHGLPPVDREFYVMQSEFYTEGAYGEPGLQTFSMNKALDERPDYVVFNGSVGALAGDNSIHAKTGETVRLYVGNGGPNLVSSFHVIGEIFDKVYIEGGDRVNANIQTTLVPAGGSAIVEFKCEAPGTLVLVDHSIFRAFNKGALGMLKVEGEPNTEIFSGKTMDSVYQPEGRSIPHDAPRPPREEGKAKTLAQQKADGEAVYKQTCFACHQATGQGIPSVFPPLAKADYFNEDPDRAVAYVIFGREGPLTVNGAQYNQVMTPQNITDEQIADVITYVLNTWGNKGGRMTVERVREIREGGPAPFGAGIGAH